MIRINTLILPLKRQWFEQIRDGKKPFEFRLRNAYWIGARLCAYLRE